MRKGKNQNHDQRLSRALSWLLRHGAIQQGLKIQPDGFVPISQVMDYLKYKKGYKNISLQQIQEVVDKNDKKRFQIKEQGKKTFIRATQGHTMKEIKSEELLKLIEDPSKYPVVVHGTFSKVWPVIRKQGLKKMKRNHIHFAPGYPKEQGVVSGMRATCDVMIEIDLQGAMKDGIKFYISSNNVILTEGLEGALSPKYFKKITNNKGLEIF